MKSIDAFFSNMLSIVFAYSWHTLRIVLAYSILLFEYGNSMGKAWEVVDINDANTATSRRELFVAGIEIAR